jgi:23S rRNA pseudouridine1911/1915/1917 synthase
MSVHQLVVKPSDDQMPLLDFLASRLNLSRKKSKALLDQRAVFVNHRRIWMARHILSTGDQVEVQLAERPALQRIRILYRDSDLLVADKPAGILSEGPDSLEAQLREELKRPELVAIHRIDRDTSGCLLLALSAAFKDRMVKLFDGHGVTKVYDAIVAGPVSSSTREIRLPLEGRTAVTHIQLIKANRTASHVRLKIDTGRTHQIRRHMAACGHSVLGDRQYATMAHDLPVLRRIPRQMLHATSITFNHPTTGAEIRVKAALPSDFVASLHALNLLTSKPLQ